MIGFKQFFEDQTRSLDKEKENYINGMARELSINPNSIPRYIESGPIEIDGLTFNQAIWEIIHPISESDTHVKIKFHKSLSPNIDQRVYIRNGDKLEPYVGELPNRIFLITMNKLAEMLGRGWQSAIQQQPPMQ